MRKSPWHRQLASCPRMWSTRGMTLEVNHRRREGLEQRWRVPQSQWVLRFQTPAFSKDITISDLLYLYSSVIVGGRGLTDDAGAQDFTIWADSFVTLLTRTYAACSVDKEFGRCVPCNWYYNMLRLWAEIILIHEHYGYITRGWKFS